MYMICVAGCSPVAYIEICNDGAFLIVRAKKKLHLVCQVPVRKLKVETKHC